MFIANSASVRTSSTSEKMVGGEKNCVVAACKRNPSHRCRPPAGEIRKWPVAGRQLIAYEKLINCATPTRRQRTTVHVACSDSATGTTPRVSRDVCKAYSRLFNG